MILDYKISKMCELIQMRKLPTPYIKKKKQIIKTHEFIYVALNPEKLSEIHHRSWGPTHLCPIWYHHLHLKFSLSVIFIFILGCSLQSLLWLCWGGGKYFPFQSNSVWKSNLLSNNPKIKLSSYNA